MFFVFLAKDEMGKSELRAETKPLHMMHLDAAAPGLRVLQSGPLLSQGGIEAGSLVIMQAERIDQVESFIAADPYVKAGLFEDIRIFPWIWKRGNPYLGNDCERTQGI
jgi:uncharacterized protein